MRDATIAAGDPEARVPKNQIQPPANPVKAVFDQIAARKISVVDFWFTEMGGRPWRLSMAADALHEKVFANGIVVDGKQVGGTMDGVIAIVPDPASTFIDPVASAPTLAVMCDIRRASGQPYLRDPRCVLRRAQSWLQKMQPEAQWMVGAEPEFFVLEKDGRRTSNAGVRELLRDVLTHLSEAGVQADWFRIGPPDALGRVQMRAGGGLRTADQVVFYKHVVRMRAQARGKHVRFLPKPIAGDGAAGMLVHHALWRGGENLFHDEKGWGATSRLCRWYAGGLLKHSRALLAFCAPTTNSYRRLLPDGVAPTELILSNLPGAAACRIPAGTTGPAASARRIKFCLADATANPYLAFAAMLMAGLDGIENRMEPRTESAGVLNELPNSLEEALAALNIDSNFLTKGGVFTDGFIHSWIEDRWKTQVLPVRSTPHAMEIELDAED